MGAAVATLLLVVSLAAAGAVVSIRILRDPSVHVPLSSVAPLPAGLEIAYRAEWAPSGAGLEINTLYLVIGWDPNRGEAAPVSVLSGHLEQRGWRLVAATSAGWSPADLDEFVWWAVEGTDETGVFRAELGRLPDFLEYLERDVLDPFDRDAMQGAIGDDLDRYAMLVLTPVI